MSINKKMYEKYQLTLSGEQINKLKKAAIEQTPITLRILNKNLCKEHHVLLTKTQIKRIEKAKKLDKGVDIKFSRTQLRYNMNKEGGLFPLLALAIPALAAAGKAAALGATGAAAGMAVKKALGDGLFLKRGGCLCSVEKQGDGIFLRSSHGRGLEKQRDGLYLYQQGKLYDGSGLLYDKNSPFQKIPILKALL